MAKSNSSRWTAADAEREIAAWRSSGKPLAAYARERGVSVQRFHYWRKRGRTWTAALTEPTQFAAAIVRPSSTVATLRVGAEIALEIEVPAAVPPEWVAAFARAVGGR